MKVYSLDNMVSVPSGLSEEEERAYALRRFRELLTEEEDEIVLVVVDEWEDENEPKL